MICNAGNEVLIALNSTGNPELLRELFYIKIKEWQFHLIHTDIGTISSFDDIKLNNSQSFNLIPTAVELCLEQHDPDLLATALSLMEQCTRMADTTEMPKILSEKWRELEFKVSEIGNKDCSIYWKDIKDWYRI